MNCRISRQNKLTSRQQDAVAQVRADRDKTLVAMHALERALAAAAPGRQQEWADNVLTALEKLETTLEEQTGNGDRSDSLLSDIEQLDPRFSYRVSQLRQQLEDIRRTAASLRMQLRQPSETPPDYADIRQRLAWLLTALRHHRAREIDLMFEAYNLDLGQVD